MKKTLTSLLVSSLLAALSFCSQASADVIKVVTLDGRVLYMDQKPLTLPHGAKQTVLKSFGEVGSPSQAPEPKEARKDGPSAAAPGSVPVTNEEIAKANLDIKKKNDEEKAKIDAENCSVLKKNLAAYAVGRVVVAKPNGERAYLTDEEVAQAKVRDEQAFKAVCK